MPAKNVVKQYTQHSFYHVYNRGVAKQKIFLDQADKRYFLNLIGRYLNPETVELDKVGVPYEKYDKDLELLCYCLMGNHFHFVFYLHDDTTALVKLMRSIGVAYTMYFNLKYKRVGPLFQGTYKASLISHEEYLLHISRYVHLNAREYETYKYSSYLTYIGEKAAEPWLHISRIRGLFGDDTAEYRAFVADYEQNHAMLEELKHLLADS